MTYGRETRDTKKAVRERVKEARLYMTLAVRDRTNLLKNSWYKKIDSMCDLLVCKYLAHFITLLKFSLVG